MVGGYFAAAVEREGVSQFGKMLRGKWKAKLQVVSPRGKRNEGMSVY